MWQSSMRLLGRGKAPSISTGQARVAIGALVVVVFFFNISVSVWNGRLANVPLFDDVDYLYDAFDRLYFPTTNSIFGILGGFIVSPPHSPLSALTAISGYSLFGPFVLAPYLANIWIIALFATVMEHYTKDLATPLQRVALILVALAAPVTHAMVNEFRPDMGAGLLFAWAGYALVHARWEVDSLAKRSALALLAVLAVAAKPSGIVVALPMVCFAATLGYLSTVVSAGGSIRATFRRMVPSAILFCLVLAIFLAIWGRSTIDYLTQVFVVNADVWTVKDGILTKILYYSVGDGGRTGLGVLFYFGAGVIALDIAWSLMRLNERQSVAALAYYLLVAVTYIGMSLASSQSVFQGSYFFVPFLIGSITGASRILARLGPHKGGLLATSATVCVAAFIIITMPMGTTYTEAAGYGDLRQIEDRVVSIIVSKATDPLCRDHRFSIAAVSPLPLVPSAVALAAEMRGVRISQAQLFFYRSESELSSAAEQVDFVLIPGPAYLKIGGTLPAFPFIQALSDHLARSTDWEPISLPILPQYGLSTLFVRSGCATR